MANLTALERRVSKIETEEGINDTETLLRWGDVMAAGTLDDTPAARRRREKKPLYWEMTAEAFDWHASLIDLAADPAAPEEERDRARRLLTEMADPTPAPELRALAAECRAEAARLAEQKTRRPT